MATGKAHIVLLSRCSRATLICKRIVHHQLGGVCLGEPLLLWLYGVDACLRVKGSHSCQSVFFADV